MKSKLSKTEDSRTVSCWVKKDVVEELDRLANKAGISRSQLLTNMIEVYTSGLSKADSVGILSLAVLIRNLKDTIQNAFPESIASEGLEIKEMYERGELA